MYRTQPRRAAACGTVHKYCGGFADASYAGLYETYFERPCRGLVRLCGGASPQ
jgi:hypothetical protein